jgi:hypothetical protein
MLSGENGVLLNVDAGSACSYDCALKGWIIGISVVYK